MEQVDQKICLDTNICIEIIKGRSKLNDLFEDYGKSGAFISSPTVFELNLRENNLEIVKEFMTGFKILDFNIDCAFKASEIFKDLRKKGITIDFNDIFIAATCIINDCTLATFNKKHFDNIKDLSLLDM